MMRCLGQYEIIRRLGAGAMGEVYLAEHALMWALYAVKVLPGELSSSVEFQRRFVNEARVMAGLRHPNIVQVHTMDVAGDVHYIVMDFVSPDGKSPQSLDDLLRARGGRLPAEEAGLLFVQVCDAIAFAHDRGVVHCDIKPANVLLGKDGAVQVSDFGLAKIMGGEFIQESIAMSLSGSIGAGRTMSPGGRIPAVDDSLGAGDTLGGRGSSRAESIVGTFHYMPPEVQEGGEWTPQGDIYSLGVLAYVLLTGTWPVGRWQMPTEMDCRIPKHWDGIVERALAPNPGQRFGSVPKMLEFLHQETAVGTVLPDQPVRHTVIIKNQRSSIASNGLSGGDIHKLSDTKNIRHPLPGPHSVGDRFSGKLLAIELGNGVNLAMAWIPPGSFMMGSPESETGRLEDENLHVVALTEGFWMGAQPVTQAQWTTLLGTNTSRFQEDGCLPVESVSWDDCQGFLRVLNARTQNAAFRLPTEAEWEYACRAGTDTRFYWGEDPGGREIGMFAWYEANSEGRPQMVGQKYPNAWGLHDMNGNVWEWCQDWYAPYPAGGVKNPKGPDTGQIRTLRGGSWSRAADDCRSARRIGYAPTSRADNGGFRLVLEA